MNQWTNPSHPITLRGAVILGYFTAVFGLLSPTPTIFGGAAVSVLISIAIGVGAFGTANNKNWGFWLLTVGAGLRAVSSVVWFVFTLWSPISMLFAFNQSIFPVALFAAVIHPQSREYRKVWFE